MSDLRFEWDAEWSMKTSKTPFESSAPGGRRHRKGFVFSGKTKVRLVEFTPEEMAYDAPPDTSDPKRFPTNGWGPGNWKKFVTFRNGFVRIDPELRKAFPDEKAINGALKKVVEMQGLAKRSARKGAGRKSAQKV